MTVADVTQARISAIDPNAFSAWCAKDILGFADGLQFVVSTNTWSGVVVIIYDFAKDTYSIQFEKTQNLKISCEATFSQVLPCNIVNVISEYLKR